MRNYKYKLYGAILGDLTGQPYEFPIMKGPYNKVTFHNPKAHITDDTIMTLASAYTAMYNLDPFDIYRYFVKMYPNAGYGSRFKDWALKEQGSSNKFGDSFGNGCLMRLSPFIYTRNYTGMIRSIQSSHNHRDSFEACFKLREAYLKCDYSTSERTRKFIDPFTEFKVDAKSTIEFCLDVCSQTNTIQHAIKKAIRCGGDTDTNASICAELHNYHKQGIRKIDAEYVESKLDKFQLKVLHDFNKQF